MPAEFSVSGVLFDFDGVIANTMYQNLESWQYAAASYGIDVIERDYFLLEGMSPKGVAEVFLNRAATRAYGEADVAAMVALKEAYYKDNMVFE